MKIKTSVGYVFIGIIRIPTQNNDSEDTKKN